MIEAPAKPDGVKAVEQRSRSDSPCINLHICSNCGSAPIHDPIYFRVKASPFVWINLNQIDRVWCSAECMQVDLAKQSND